MTTITATPAAPVEVPLLPAGLTAIVDTNVLVDLYSCSDLLKEYESLGLPDLARAMRTPKAIWRRARARESLLLVWHFHLVEARTFHLVTEQIDILLRPDVAKPGGGKFTGAFATVFVNFVKERVLSGWNSGTNEDVGRGLKGTAIDNLLLATAKRAGLPLVTNEGYSESGVADIKLRGKCVAQGVPVFIPRHFWLGKLDPTVEGARLLHRFDTFAPPYLAEASDRLRPHLRKALVDVRAVLHHVLTGEIVGGERLPVEVPGV